MESKDSSKVEAEPSKPAKTEDSEKAVESPDPADNDEADKQPEATGGWGGWASSWLDPNAASAMLGKAVSSVTAAVEVAKTKSTEAYGLVSKDLEEVSSQALTVFGSASTNIKQTLEVIDEKTDVLADKAVDSVKKSVTSIWRFASGYAQQMFDEDDLDSEALLIQSDSGSPVALDRLQAQLLALASDPETFLTDPDPLDDLANDWKNWQCDLEKRQGEISDLMVSNVHIRKNYSSLVPEKLVHQDFWRRYFYKVHLIELQERKRQLLKARAEAHTSGSADKDVFNAWDDDEEEKKVDIPPEVQDRLLSDYERELIAKKLEKARLDADVSVSGRKSDSSKKFMMKEDSDDMVMVVGKDISPSTEKDENSSDDWEKLSAGEKSPRKSSKK